MKLLTSFWTWHTPLALSRRSFLARFSAMVLLAVTVASSAQDIEPLAITDLDPETRVAVSNLAISLSSASVNATSATVEDNVSAILTLLQSYKYRFASASAPGFSTYPIYGGTVGLSSWLSWNLNEESVGAASTRPKSFLYEIQRALYGQQGVPSAGDALLPTLLRIEDLISQSTNSSSSVDLSNVEWFLSSLDSNVGSILGDMSYLSDIDLIVNNLSSILSSTYANSAYDVSSDDPAISVVDAVNSEHLYNLYSLLSDSLPEFATRLESIDGFGYDSASYLGTLADDLAALRLQLSTWRDDQFSTDTNSLVSGDYEQPNTTQMASDQQQAQMSAVASNNVDEATLNDYSSNPPELPHVEFDSNLPFDVPFADVELDVQPFSGSGDIPISSEEITLGDITIPVISLSTSTGSTFRNAVDGFSSRAGPVVLKIYDLAFAVCVLLLVGYEWKYYVSQFELRSGSLDAPREFETFDD